MVSLSGSQISNKVPWYLIHINPLSHDWKYLDEQNCFEVSFRSLEHTLDEMPYFTIFPFQEEGDSSGMLTLRT